MQLRTMLATGLLCASMSNAAHADTSFAAGSIIIPATSTYQTDCGAVSIYGFVYNVLRANAWLAANGHGTIELHYAVNETKGSPNRCTPTNLLTPPAPSLDPKWNDGCDFQVVSSNPATVPVKLIVNTTAHTASSDLASWNTIATNDAVHASLTHERSTYPNWVQTTVSAPNTTTIRYLGGAFIVDDLDAVVLRRLISGDLVAQDAASGGNNIDFSGFKSSGCSFGSTVGGQLNFHVAQVAFTAPIPKVLSAKPPRLALLATDRSPTNSGQINDGILQVYLSRAGLSFAGAGGCPAGGHLRTTAPALCPSAGMGQIFDLFDVRDLMGVNLAASKLGLQISGQPAYKMLWAPHWALASSAGPNAAEQEALKNISSFADGQNGVMAECASIASFEGYNSGGASMTAIAATGSQFQTCANSTCAQIARGIGPRQVFNHGSPAIVNDSRRNCTDPGLANGTYCTYMANPGDTFVQVGDYKFNTTLNFGTVSDFKPNTGAQYKTGVKTLVSGVGVDAGGTPRGLDNTKLGSAALVRTSAGFEGEFVTRFNKDNDPAKSNIVYIGFHDQTDAVAGTKIVLQTLLLLGDPPVVPTTREVTRSSPIVATINGEVDIVQGTFEKITPAPTSKNATSDADAAAFEFPFLKGHMRAIRALQVSTAGIEFKDLTATQVAFDAATNIPASTPAGCGTNFAGTCRTVFTHTAAGVRPPSVFFTTGAAGVKALVAPTLNAANQNVVITTVLAGALGGVDRSTVAVVGPSLLAGSPTRPQMIYFGASDGMVHAVCAQAVASTGCTTAGRELWAFIPRTQLPNLRKNLSVINGSPRFADLFGDFDPTDGVTARTFKTIMLIPSGSGDPGITGEEPSVTALDITDPFNPTILWEYTTPSSRGVTDFGQSIELTTGTVNVGAGNKVLAFVHSNNGGTGLAGSVVTALDIETGLKFWQTGHEYGGLSGAASPAPRLAVTAPVPAAGIPGAALAIDRTGAVAATDVVYATLYGDVWRLNAKDGTNAYGGTPGNPMFRFSDDLKPIGATPAIFSDTPASPTSLFIAVVSGGYFDPVALSLWSGPQHHIVAFSINALAANIPLTETSGALLKFKNDLPPGDRGFAQPTVIGDQLFVTSDSTDVNSAAFGLTADTGHLTKLNLADGGGVTTTVITGGAGSIAHNGNDVYAASGNSIEQVTAAGIGTINTLTANATSAYGIAKVARKMWLTTL